MEIVIVLPHPEKPMRRKSGQRRKMANTRLIKMAALNVGSISQTTLNLSNKQKNAKSEGNTTT